MYHYPDFVVLPPESALPSERTSPHAPGPKISVHPTLVKWMENIDAERSGHKPMMGGKWRGVSIGRKWTKGQDTGEGG
jgi:hypothetical protein